MKLSKKEAEVLDEAIRQWEEGELLEPEKADELKNSYSIIRFDWQSLAFYAFIFAVGSLVVAVIALLADQWLMELAASIFEAPDIYKSLLFLMVSCCFYYFGWKRRRMAPQQIYSNEALFLFGVFAMAGSIIFLGLALDNGSGHFSLLLLAGALIYGLLGLWFPSKLIWIFAIISLGAWFGAETGFRSSWEPYFLGMNYPLRFTLFGLAVTGLSFGMKSFVYTRNFHHITLLTGLLYLFISLWLLSIFGNYGSLEVWYNIRQTKVALWSILMAAISIACVYAGLKNQNDTLREFGVFFLFINLYSRYFEYGWDNMHKALFFAILAFSFWVIGKKAEKIWMLGGKKNV